MNGHILFILLINDYGEHRHLRLLLMGKSRNSGGKISSAPSLTAHLHRETGPSATLQGED